MRSIVSPPDIRSIRLPPDMRDDDVRFSEALVEHFLSELTRPDDVVLDPFAGYGTTLLVAERMGRHGWGVELDEERAAFARSTLSHPERLLLGDSRRLGTLELPQADFSISSPPYMGRNDPEDPLTAYREPGTGYEDYLLGLRSVYEQVGSFMKTGGHVVVEVSNIRTEQGVTPLAWDLARELGVLWTFRGEVVVDLQATGHGYEHSYALVYET
ncbi:MAG: DNA methyltransferase [Acidobacteriota bacterium]